MRLSFQYSWSTRPLRQPWHSICLAIVGLVFSALSIYTFITTSEFIELSVETEGTVIDFTQRKGSYRPVVRYFDSSSREYVLLSTVGSDRPQFSLNEKVVVLYAPDNPSEARINRFWHLWFWTVLAGIFGGAFSFGAIVLWIYRRQIFALAGYPELAGADVSSKRQR